MRYKIKCMNPSCSNEIHNPRGRQKYCSNRCNYAVKQYIGKLGAETSEKRRRLINKMKTYLKEGKSYREFVKDEAFSIPYAMKIAELAMLEMTCDLKLNLEESELFSCKYAMPLEWKLPSVPANLEEDETVGSFYKKMDPQKE